MSEHVFWTAEAAIKNEYWVLRYHPKSTHHADGSTSLSVNFPAFITTEWVASPDEVARKVAYTLNHAPVVAEAARELLAAVDFDNNGRITGLERVGGNGGMISLATSKAADKLRLLLSEGA